GHCIIQNISPLASAAGRPAARTAISVISPLASAAGRPAARTAISVISPLASAAGPPAAPPAPLGLPHTSPPSGRPFLQSPGPTLVPDRIVRPMAQPIIDHRGPRFEALVRECLDGLGRIFQTDRGHVLLYPGSGTGAWEATIVNTLSPGDRVLACVNGFFSAGFARTAAAFGVELERLDLPYGAGVPAAEVQARLERDHAHDIRAVLVVHNETSTGVTS